MIKKTDKNTVKRLAAILKSGNKGLQVLVVQSWRSVATSGHLCAGAATSEGTAQKLPEDSLVEYQFKVTMAEVKYSIDLKTFAAFIRPLPLKKQLFIGRGLVLVHNLCKAEDLLHLILDRVTRHVATEKKRISSFFSEIWSQKNDPAFPLSVLERVIKIESFLLQKLIIDHLEKIVRESRKCENSKESFKEELLTKVDLKSWITLCSKSESFFTKSAAIINTVLRSCKASPIIFCFTFAFHDAVKQLCATPMELLYPIPLRSLVNSMTVDPESMDKEARNEVLDIIVKGVLESRTTAICLLSHFQKWLPYFFLYCGENDILFILDPST